MFRHLGLHLDRAAHRIDDAVELDQQAVAHGSHDAPLVRDDRRVDEITPDGVERRQSALLVDPHQAGIADDIRTHDDGKLVLYLGTCHSFPASPSHYPDFSTLVLGTSPSSRFARAAPLFDETGPAAAGEARTTTFRRSSFRRRT